MEALDYGPGLLRVRARCRPLADVIEYHLMSTFAIISEPEDTRPDWWSWASCNTGDARSANVFFPDLGDVPVPDEDSTDEEREAYSKARLAMLADEAKAKEVCADCAVTDLCLAAAIARQEQTGVWGGFNFGRKRERTNARKHLRLTLVAA